jgi:purine catabolism regulator
MAITVGDLVDIPHLATKVHAGRGGLDREIHFAHACEMPAPWEWLGEGDLLLTSGMSLPERPREQAEFVSRMADAGLSGISIGEVPELPPISYEMGEIADRRRFPLLRTAYEVPWIAVVRAVVDSNAGEEHARLVMTARLYDRVREAAAAGQPPAALLDSVGEEVHARLAVYDNEHGCGLLLGSARLSAELGEAFIRAVREHRGRMPAVVRLATAGERAIVVPVPSTRSASLIVVPTSARDRPDATFLQHVATVAALEVERSRAQRAEQLRLGAELLAEMLDARIDRSSAQRRLAAHGIVSMRVVLAAWGPSGELDSEVLHDRLIDAGMDHLLLRRDDCILTLLAEPDRLDEISDLISRGARVGVSDAFMGFVQASDAMRQAIWALQATNGGGNWLVRYGDRNPPFLPSTVMEARGVVQRILGSLLIYDREHNTELVRTLRVFLESNRSWKRAAEILFVHKQTLVYRIRRIEQLTGKRLDDMQHVAELWLALRALELAGADEPDDDNDARAHSSNRSASAS